MSQTFEKRKSGWLAAAGVLLVCVGWAAAIGPATAPRDAAARDAAVLQVVFDDLLSANNSDAPAEWRHDPSEPVYVSRERGRWQPSAEQVLEQRDAKKWKALSADQLDAAREAAGDLVARRERGDPLPQVKSTSGRIKIYEDAGAATQPAPGRFPIRAMHVLAPGYSKDENFAVVHLSFPWSIHSGVATYVLQSTDAGWKLVLRDFTYYM